MKGKIRKKLREALMDEDYPEVFDRAHFKTLRSFKKRVAYCEQYLTRISSGSSRIVYKIDDEKVLKLAKNRKGLAQNETEAEWGGDNYYDGVLAHTFDSDPNNLWVEMQLARVVNKDTFERVLGYPLEAFTIYIKYFDYTHIRNNEVKSGLYKRMLNNPDDNGDIYDAEFFSEDEFASGVTNYMHNTNSPNGDLVRLSSFGLVKRDGKEAIVIIDFGTTSDIYNTYYS